MGKAWFAAALAAAASILAGCASEAERAARWAAVDDAKCKSYGAQPGTPAYVQCRAQLDAARTQAIATAAAAPVPVVNPAPIVVPQITPSVFQPPPPPSPMPLPSTLMKP